MLTELRRFLMEEDGEIVEWAVFMLILLALTVAIIIIVGRQAGDMWAGIQRKLNEVLNVAGIPQR